MPEDNKPAPAKPESPKPKAAKPKAAKPSGLIRLKLTAPVETLPSHGVGDVVTVSLRKAQDLGLNKTNAAAV